MEVPHQLTRFLKKEHFFDSLHESNAIEDQSQKIHGIVTTNFYSINIFKCNARIAVIYDMPISILRVHHTDYSFSLRGFSANVSKSDDSDRALQICSSTAITSNASVLSSPDVDLVSVLINFSVLCERSLHAYVTGMVTHISRSL